MFVQYQTIAVPEPMNFLFCYIYWNDICSYNVGYKPFDDLPKLVDQYVDGKLPVNDLVTGYFKLDQVNEAIDLMIAGKR